MSGILAKKIGMSRVFDETSGQVIPVTALSVDKNIVTQIKTPEKDGYSAVVLGFGARKHPTKTKKFYHMCEFPISGDEDYLEKGKEITLSVLEGIEKVTVSGTSKGKGFTGVMKRYNFGGGRDSHGAHGFSRQPGSIGACVAPGRVWKGQKMAGHHGNSRTTLRNRPLVKLIPEKNMILVRGAVPGPAGGLIELKFESK